MPLNDKQKGELKKAMRFWADKHPNPNGIVFQLASGAEYTPKQIANAVVKETELGKLEFRVVELAIEQGHKFEEILEGYYGERPILRGRR